MTIQALGCKFKVNQVDFSSDFSTRINIKKRKERIMYKTLSNKNKINLAYVMSAEVTPENALFISDRSTILTQNRIPNTQSVYTTTFNTFTISVDKFLVTDQFTTETATKERTALFYTHTLDNFNVDVIGFATKTLVSVEFADQNGQSVSLSEYLLDSTNGLIYNNQLNEYDPNNGVLNVLFVKYTVKTTVDSTQTIEVFRELLNNKPIFTQADFDDIDDYGFVLAGHKKYLIKEISGGSSFQVTLPNAALYGYKETPHSRIKVLKPTAVDIKNPWFVQITNGKFITSLPISPATSVNYKYYIAEFYGQSFFPYPPYKAQHKQRTTWITNTLIQTPKNIFYNEHMYLFIELIIKDKEGELKYAYSNDPAKIGTVYSGTTVYTDGIVSIDELNGFIELTNKVYVTDLIYASYHTEEDQYEFTSVDFNPVNNLDILNQRIVIYINPETAYTGSLTQTLYYLVVDSMGRILYSSQAANNADSLDPATQKILNEDFLVNGETKQTFFYDKESTGSEDLSFLDKYTVNSVLLTSTITPSGLDAENYQNNSRFLILADISVGENQSHNNLTKFDVRIRGGGIKEEYTEQALAQQPESAWYWDQVSRRPYPSGAATYIEIPQTVLTDHGGSFSRDQVNNIVEKHMRVGGYAVVKTYGIDPVIMDCTAAVSYVTLEWPTYGPSVHYNAYYSMSINGPFLKYNSLLLNDDTSGNTYVIAFLNASTNYFFKIGAVDENGDESFSQIISIMTQPLIA